MTLSRRTFLQTSAAAGMSASAALRAAAPGRVLTAADMHPAGYPTVAAVRWMSDELERQTGGALSIRTYHAGQLGRESDTVTLARHGALDITRVNMGTLNNPFPITRILCLPYEFDSVAHMRRAVDGAPGREILDAFAARDLVGLAFYDAGLRSFYNVRRPIHTPADMHGLKLRVPPSDIFMAMVRAFGANPTPLGFGEAFSAMQTHMIDGAENNIRGFDSSRQFEVARYWSNTQHAFSPEALLMSRRSFEGLPASQRELLLATAQASVAVMRRLWDEAEATSRERMAAGGVAFNDVDLPAFHAAAEPVRTRALADPDLLRLHRRIRALA
ncbi:TRAP transporter substrate-binding protein [Chiayiivirga flava]|uniref:Tripartite ATP-independent transporter DctP family solute receptor n=1 Tax=Chiayiivirga flava TaxID=659595 RepID=A0A7W8D8W0_9GAMM|nr:TRAP transporter substrate-binding protein [Chiayiivirga flava]MBB5208935.1 tripartite ATP-independent transporter DctP family solute receptor [Chiayiivirga flava]